jgi:hypothetical protein
MFLAFPLDYQTKEIISQAVGYFGSVITWTSNARCRSRILLRCKVSLISRIPRSLLICQGTAIGNHGSSWTVPVFVLSSNPTDEFPGDEDQIPPNGNPHPVNPHFLHQMNPQGENLGFFEDVGDLDNIQQENIDQGWEAPQAGDQQDNLQGWGQWIQQKGEQVEENVLGAIDQLAEVAMANAIANGVMQAPDFPQHSVSVSSETNGFFRAQGSPVTLELPLPEFGSDRTLALSDGSLQSFSNDYSVRELATRLNIHVGFGPAPSVEMLLQELARSVRTAHDSLPMKSPIPHSSWNNITLMPELDPWLLNMDNLNWGNNAEASSSAGPRLPRL